MQGRVAPRGGPLPLLALHSHGNGRHTKQKRTPFLDYPIGTTQQSEEHVLELGRSHLLERQDALSQMPGAMQRTWLRHFTVWP